MAVNYYCNANIVCTMLSQGLDTHLSSFNLLVRVLITSSLVSSSRKAMSQSWAQINYKKGEYYK